MIAEMATELDIISEPYDYLPTDLPTFSSNARASSWQRIRSRAEESYDQWSKDVGKIGASGQREGMPRGGPM